MATSRAQAIALASFIIVCLVAWLAIEIPRGILTDTDELLTAERSREMLLSTPWVVHFNFQRSFAKPFRRYVFYLPLFFTAICRTTLSGSYRSGSVVGVHPRRRSYTGRNSILSTAKERLG